MTNSTITDQLSSQILQFLDDEAEFLAKLESCTSHLGAHPVGTAFQRELVEKLTSIQKDVAVRNVQRATVQRNLAGELFKTPAAIRLSTVRVDADADTNLRLQQRRREVRQKALSVETNLRSVLGQMMESNAIVTAVLDAVLGAPVDRSRYDADGKPVPQISQVEGRRVA